MNTCCCADPDCMANGCRQIRQEQRKEISRGDYWSTYIKHTPMTKDANNAEEFAGILSEIDDLELDINEETLAILAVVQMQMSKGLTAEDLIKRLLTEPT
jgi:methyltransferase-like protein